MFIIDIEIFEFTSRETIL